MKVNQSRVGIEYLPNGPGFLASLTERRRSGKRRTSSIFNWLLIIAMTIMTTLIPPPPGPPEGRPEHYPDAGGGHRSLTHYIYTYTFYKAAPNIPS